MSPQNVDLQIATRRPYGRWLARAIVAVIVCAGVLSIYIGKGAQWDFRIYYASAVLNQSGISPYESANFKNLVGDTTLYYPYPPYTLFLFYPFTAFGLGAALAIHLTLKILAVCAIVTIWLRTFKLYDHKWLFFLFVFFAFNGAVLIDLRSGNCCMFEQLLIAAGFYCYARGKIVWFAAAISLAAGLKLGPILLLGILVTSGRKREVLCAGVFGLLFIAAMLLTSKIWPQLFSAFTHAIGRLQESAPNNPATWPLICDIVGAIENTAGVHIPRLVNQVAFSAVGISAATVSLLSLRRFGRRDHPEARLWRICLICLLYGVVMPRFKNYTYILLVGPAFYVLASGRLPHPLILASAMGMMFTYRGYIELGRVFQPFFWVAGEYYSLVLAWLLWGCCCWYMMWWGRNGALEQSYRETAKDRASPDGAAPKTEHCPTLVQ